MQCGAKKTRAVACSIFFQMTMEPFVMQFSSGSSIAGLHLLRHLISRRHMQPMIWMIMLAKRIQEQTTPSSVMKAAVPALPMSGRVAIINHYSLLINPSKALLPSWMPTKRLFRQLRDTVNGYTLSLPRKMRPCASPYGSYVQQQLYYLCPFFAVLVGLLLESSPPHSFGFSGYCLRVLPIKMVAA